jgi:hypothetical protein
VIDALTKNDFEYATDITKGSNDRIIFLDIIKFIKNTTNQHFKQEMKWLILLLMMALLKL